MKKRYAAFILGVFVIVPGVVHADAPRDAQISFLYAQVIALLQQEIALLEDARAAHPSIFVDALRGAAPYTALLTLGSLTGTEALDFGDGHSTGSNGCVRNALGWCAIGRYVSHTYQFPGTYLVTLYAHDPLRTVATTSIIVLQSPASAQ